MSPRPMLVTSSTILVTAAQTPIAMFTSPNLGTNEYIAESVATDGQLVLLGSGAGSARLYNPFTKQQLAMVTLPDPRFETSVALQGATGVVGSAGGAFLYDFSNLANITRRTLIPSDASRYFGPAVDMSGDTIIVGGTDDNLMGAAYLFNRVTGSQFAKVSADVPTKNDSFGISVAVDGDLAVVGNPTSIAPDRSAIYLFNTQPGVVGNPQLDKYTAGLYYGYNVDLSGETIIGLEAFGQSYVWTVTGEPASLPLSAGNRLRSDGVTISNQLIAVGFDDQNIVRIYSPTGQYLRDLWAPPGSPIGFGASVAVGGHLLVVSAPGGAPAKCAAYVYRVQDVLVPEPSACLLVSCCLWGLPRTGDDYLRDSCLAK